MFNYDLKISIFSKDKNIEKIVNEIEPLEGYNHTISYSEDNPIDKIDESDIVIIDEDLLEDNLKYLLKDKKVIFIANSYKKEYEIFSAVIIKPLDYDYLKYELNKLFRNIKIEDLYQFKDACLNTTINSMDDMFWIKTVDGIHTLLNDKFCEVVGKEKEDVTGKDHYYIWDVSKDDPNSGADLCKKSEEEVIKADKTLKNYETVTAPTGTIQLVTSKTPLKDKYGRVIGTIGFGHDVTDIKNLSIENQIMLDSFPVGMLITDDKGIIVNVNTEFQNYFGISKEKIVGHSCSDWIKNVFSNMKYNDEKKVREAIYYSSDGKKNIELKFNNILDVFDNITGQICVLSDITLEKLKETELKNTSSIDDLSGLFNPRYLREYIQGLEDGTPLTLFYLDLDHFKEVNDTYGHQKGDEVIRSVAKLIKNYFDSDVVVRKGGDEFLVVKLGFYDEEYLKEVCDGLLNKFRSKFNPIKEISKLSVSIGVGMGYLRENKFKDILNKSDNALYAAKDNGRDCYVIDSNILEPVITLSLKQKNS